MITEQESGLVLSGEFPEEQVSSTLCPNAYSQNMGKREKQKSSKHKRTGRSLRADQREKVRAAGKHGGLGTRRKEESKEKHMQEC